MILLVDDNQSILECTAEALFDFGYLVMTATNGQEAVELFASHQSDIDMVMTDINMPLKDGIKAANEMRHIRGDVPIVFATGQDLVGLPARIGEFGNYHLLSKPLSFELLDQYMQEVLR